MSSKYNELAGAAPYFDDFNPKHNFMRILFNPSRAVQARELTQLQTILQNQSDQVARHLFKNNTTITGARISTIENKPAAYLERFEVDNDKTFDGAGSVDNYNTDSGGVFESQGVVSFDDTWIGVTFGNGDNPDGSDSDKQITISHYAYADNAGQSFPIVYYEFSGKNVKPGEIFRPVGEHAGGQFPRIAIGWPTKNVSDLQNVVATDEENPFKAMAASCESGIVYSKGHFLTVVENEIIASNDPSEGVIEIGYRIIQDIVTESNSEMVPADELDDEAGEVPLGRKLRDPASGSRNFNAPGAHRYRVRPELFAITYADSDQRAAKIAEIEAELGIDSLSEEFESFMVIDNGRVVKDQSEVQYADILKLLARRTYDESGNYTVDDFNLSLEEDPDDSTKFVAEMGPGKAYVKGFEVKKKISTRLKLDRARTTRLDDRTVKSLGALPYFVLQPSEGTESGIECGSTDGNWIEVEKQEKVYLLNQKIDPLNPTFPAENSPKVIAETRTISLDRDEDYIRLYLEDVGNGADEIRNAKSIVAYRPDGLGGFTYAWVNLAQRRESGANKKTIPIFGGDIRPLLIKMNNKILKETSNHRYQVVERHVESSTPGTSPTITITLPAGQEFKNRRPLVLVYEEGAPRGYDGGVNNPPTVLDVSNMDVTWSPNEITFGGGGMEASTSYVIYVKVQRIGSTAQPGSKSLSNETKTINVESFDTIDGEETDTVTLLEDAYDIVDVFQTSNCDETNAAGGTEYQLSTDELLRLKFDDGQSDVQYGPGSVSGWRSLWKLNKAVDNDPTSYRIEYRRFTHSSQNGAIHTVNSYAGPFGLEEQHKVPRYNSSRFGRIDLINCMDFRQTETNLAGSISRCPLPLSTVEYAEEFYVGRIDIITLNKNGEFMVHEGVPSENPTPPNVPEGSMILYKLHIPAYTFSTRDIQIEAHKNTRYTMKDISRLEDRIDRLEDSVSLSLLEKNAMDMKITDPKTGFDRFKSGIFVDDFEGLAHTESANPEFYISVDRVERTIHCPVEKNNIGMNFNEGSTTNQGITRYKNLVTLTPDTTERIVAQNDTATKTVNLNPYLFYTWVGSIELTPAVDTWHETNYLPQRNVTVGSWSPPEGFNPNWRIDDIEVNWVGVPPDPTPLPPQPSPPQNATQADDQQVRHTDIQFSSQSMRDFMLLVADGASPEEINDAAAEITDQLAGDRRRRASLMGAAMAARNSSGLDFDINQELIDQALQVVGFDGETGTSTSLGSSNVLSSSDAGSIATQIGPIQFDARGGNLKELNNQTTQPIGNRRIGNVISNNNNNSGAGDQATNQNTAVQQQTITEVRDVLTRHTDTNKEDRVIDRSEIYWMREQEIEFIGEGFRPGMLVTGYLDNKQVEVVPDGNDFKFNDDGEDRVRVDSNGKVKGFFKIPPRKFTTGTKSFLLIDDEATSQGSADFTSKGMLTTRQEVITTTRSIETRQVFTPPPQQPNIVQDRPSIMELLTGDFVDPVAQSFQITTEGGCLLSSISVYFATKAGDFRENSTLGSLNVSGRPSDDLTLSEALEAEYPGHPKDPLQYIGPSEIQYNAPVTLYLVEMRDGTPTSNIVPLSTVTKESTTVNSNPYVPKDGETEFRFNDPVYLEEGAEYAFIIVTTSKEYNVWMTELGEVDRFDGTEGVGVAEQPYLGSLFKSQNSSTWTPEQTQTMTFKAQRYNYSDNVSGEVEFADSKFEDTLIHDDNGNRVNRPLYSSEFTGNPHDEKTYVSTIFPMFGEIALGETSIVWKHKFSSGVEMDMHNNKRNVVYNKTFPTNEFVIDNTNDYLVRAYLSTNRSNLSPIIDTEQSRTIAIRNMVKGIEAFEEEILNYVDNPDNIPDRTGVDTTHNYQEKDVFVSSLTGDGYIVMENGTGADPIQFSTSDETTTTFKNELSTYIGEGKIILASDVGLVIDPNNIGNAGGYVSKPINLKSPADDLRLIMDSSEPGTSYIKPYYRILNHSPKFVVVKEQNDPSEDYRIHESMAGETERIFYVTTPSETAGPLSFENVDITGNENYISINGFDSKTNETTGQPTKVAYFSGLTDNTAFNTANTSGRTGDYTAFATNSATLKGLISKGKSIPFWDNSTSYLRGDVVYHAGAFWYSTGYVGSIPDWESSPTTPYVAGNIVKHSGNLYLNRNGSNGDPIDNPGIWKELSADYYGVGTVPTDPGSAWERIPSVFFKQNQDEIQTDDTSQWRPMVLKTGRFETNDFKNNQFYESTWVPKTEPGVEFNTFAVKLEFVTENSRAAVPRAKNLRVIATL